MIIVQEEMGRKKSIEEKFCTSVFFSIAGMRSEWTSFDLVVRRFCVITSPELNLLPILLLLQQRYRIATMSEFGRESQRRR